MGSRWRKADAFLLWAQRNREPFHHSMHKRNTQEICNVYEVCLHLRDNLLYSVKSVELVLTRHKHYSYRGMAFANGSASHASERLRNTRQRYATDSKGK